MLSRKSTVSDFDDFDEQAAQEAGHAIKYRTCSWQKTAALLFSEYICLAILSFPWSYSVLGLVPGIILTVIVAFIVLYTSLILWRFCLKHPEIHDVCDIGRMLFGSSNLAYDITAIFFCLNNIFIQALHLLVGAELLNTLTNSAACTIVFSIITAIICICVSLPRTLNQLSWLATFSAGSMAVAILLAIIFAGIQDNPFGFIAGQSPIVTAFPVKGTTFVSGMSAFLNITYTLVGQIVLPSFIAEMKDPREFPKALWAVTIAETIVYILCGGLMYHWLGNQYVTAPAFGSLQPTFKKIAFSFAIPTIVFLGALYSSVTSRFVFFRIFRNSPHRYSNTAVGWMVWVGIVVVTWIMAFIIAEIIPFFSDMLSLMSSLFDTNFLNDCHLATSHFSLPDGWFGFIFWGMAYLSLHHSGRWSGPWKTAETLFNYFLILLGFYILIAGTYTSIQSIIDSYEQGAFGSPFTCASNAI